MLQQYIAGGIIFLIILRLYKQKRDNNIKSSEFFMWLIFWVFVFVFVVFIKKIDLLVASLGFSSSGIDVALYMSVAVLFYLFIRMRLKLEKMEKNLTKLVQEFAIKK